MLTNKGVALKKQPTFRDAIKGFFAKLRHFAGKRW